MAAYVIAEIDVTDAQAYEAYRARTPAVIAAYGGRFIVRGGAADAKEGAPPAGRVVVVEFPDMATARRFYDSAEYQEILPLRTGAAASRLFVVEGV